MAGQGKLPSIDDDCNQLEVAEYVDEIYQYYWIMEVIFSISSSLPSILLRLPLSLFLLMLTSF